MKKALLLIMAFAALLASIAGRFAITGFQYIQELERFRAQHFESWIADQRGAAMELDEALAEVLVASLDRLEPSLKVALQKAYRGQEAVWRIGIPHEVYGAADRWNYWEKYQEMAAYLEYLLEGDLTLHLTLPERESLAVMRAYTDAFSEEFAALFPHVRYQVADRRGHNMQRYHPWYRIVRNPEIPSLVEGVGKTINMLPGIGAGDPQYMLSRTGRYQPLPVLDSYGLTHSGERRHSESEMLHTATAFLATFAVGDVVDPYTGKEVNMAEADTVMASRGHGSSMGSYMGFALKDSATGWTYDIGVTEIGGHIVHINLREKGDIVSPDELVKMKETFISLWSEFEGVNLSQISFGQNEETLSVSLAPLVDGIVYVDKQIGATVSFYRSKPGLRIDASRYFALYSIHVPSGDLINPRQAVESLPEYVAVVGHPRLELHHDALFYVIPVQGVDKVDAVHINAHTGGYGGISYNHSGW